MPTKKNQPVVSVIIPTIGRKTVKETVAALKRQTRPPDEIVVIEDIKRRGPAWARNKGFQKARGNLIVFTDDDCIAKNDWLERFVNIIEEHKAAMVSSHYLESDPFLSEIRQRRNFPKTIQIKPKGFIGNTGNVIFRRECLEECRHLDGFIFNPIFRSYASEDIDLVCRLSARGHKLVFIDNKVRHLKKVTPIKYIKHQLKRGIGIGILYQLQKETKERDLPDQSLLWNQNKANNSSLKWALMVWKKILGPFDYKSFSCYKHFVLFWAGEKAQSFGFLFCLFFKRIAKA